MSLIILLVLGIVVGIVVGMGLYLHRRGSNPIPTGGLDPLPWQAMTLNQITIDLVSPYKAIFLEDGKSLAVPVAEDAVHSHTIWLLQHESGNNGSGAYKVSSILPLPASNIQPISTLDGSLVVAGVPGLILAYRRQPGKHAEYGRVPQALYSTLFDDIESLVAYGEGVVINYTQVSGRQPMLLEKLPAIGPLNGPDTPSQITVRPKSFVASVQSSAVGHLKFVGATRTALVFWQDSKFPILQIKGKLTALEAEASVALAVSGLRILALSPTIARVFNDSLEEIWAAEAPPTMTFVDGQVVADQVITVADSATERALTRSKLDDPPLPNVRDLSETTGIDPAAQISVGKLGWIVVSAPTGKDVWAPESIAFLDLTGARIAYTIEQYRLLNKTLLPNALQGISDAAGRFRNVRSAILF